MSRVASASGPLPMARRAVRVLLLALAATLAATGCGPSTDTPTGVARLALERLSDGDLVGLGELACAGQADLVRQRLGLAGDLISLLPGLNVDRLVDAIQLDTGRVDVDDERITGDTATVRVHGDVAISFDAEVIRPILREVLEAQGTTVDDETLDVLLAGLETFGRNVPLDETLSLIREDGTWRICQPLS